MAVPLGKKGSRIVSKPQHSRTKVPCFSAFLSLPGCRQTLVMAGHKRCLSVIWLPSHYSPFLVTPSKGQPKGNFSTSSLPCPVTMADCTWTVDSDSNETKPSHILPCSWRCFCFFLLSYEACSLLRASLVCFYFSLTFHQLHVLKCKTALKMFSWCPDC